MGRFNRVVAIDIPHHVTQRGNGRRFVLEADADRTVYLKLLRENISLYGVALVGYCLMSNHIHLIAVPHEADGLAQALKQTPRALRCLLERHSPVERPRVAGKILLLPAGPVASLGGLALHRTQSRESRFGIGGRVVALVQRSLSLLP
jgi:REP element-mobilizing transposase RayT